MLSLRTQVSRKLHRLPLRFFDQNKAGEILSRVTSDLDKISEVLQTGLLKMIVAIGTVIGSLIVMFYYSVPLTLIFLVFMAICMVITKVVASKNLLCAAQRQGTIGSLTGVVEEYYKGRDVIKAYNHEDQSIQQVVKVAEENRAANQKADFLTICINPLIRLLTRLSQAVIAVIAGYAMLNGTMTIGVVQAFFQYVNQTAEPLTEASYMINSLQSALASAERTFQLLTQAAGRAGRGDLPGRVVIQTYDPEHYSIQAASEQDYEAFYRQEIAFRAIGGYPPAGGMLAIHASSEDEAYLSMAMEYLKKFLDLLESKTGIQVIGPGDETIARIQDVYRKVLYLRHPNENRLTMVKEKVEQYIEMNEGYQKIHIQYERA